MDFKQRLLDRYLQEKAQEDDIISMIKVGHNVNGALSALWYRNEVFALHNLINESNIALTKDYFYICGLLDECMITKFESRILDYGVSHISYALLSDNKPLIERYAVFKHQHLDFIIKQGNLIHTMQCIIRDDQQGLEKDIATYERVTATKKGQIVKPDLIYFKGMLNRDEEIIKQAIMQLLKDHKKRNKYLGLAAEFISMPALGYAKLAWLKGVEVDIDHPLIPKELLPYRLLEKYTDMYDFLKDL